MGREEGDGGSEIDYCLHASKQFEQLVILKKSV